MLQRENTSNILTDDPEMKIFTAPYKQIWLLSNNGSGVIFDMFNPVLSTTPGIDGVYYNHNCEIHGFRARVLTWIHYTGADENRPLYNINLHVPNITTRTTIVAQHNSTKQPWSPEFFTYDKYLDFYPLDTAYSNQTITLPFKPELRRTTTVYHDKIDTKHGFTVAPSSYEEFLRTPPGDPVSETKPWVMTQPVVPVQWNKTVSKMHTEIIDIKFKYPIQVKMSLDIHSYPKNVMENQLIFNYQMRTQVPHNVYDILYHWTTTIDWEIYYKAMP